MKKKLSFIAIAMLFAGSLSAQSLNIHLKNGEKVEYSAEEVEYVDFTEAQSDPYNGHEYVDLGLPSGLKWATCNVGASAPEEYGDYYAWGEIETKDVYTKDNYKYYHIGTGTDADGFDSERPVWDDLGVISGTEYDVVRQKWGSSWRMPTQNEFQELYDKCTWNWVKKNNVNGYKVTGPNGNWIFLPAAGYRDGTYLSFVGSFGKYCTGTQSPYSPDYARGLSFFDKLVDESYGQLRYYGFSVRPVTE